MAEEAKKLAMKHKTFSSPHTKSFCDFVRQIEQQMTSLEARPEITSRGSRKRRAPTVDPHMGNPFQIYGPFDISKPLVAGKEYQSTFWAECDEAHPRLSAAKGVYVFSLRNGSNYSPQYVGMTKRYFAKEVFNPNNLVKILDDFVKEKGTLCLHLLAKPNDANTGFYSASLKTLLWTEMFVLLLCRNKNPEIANIMGKPFLDDAGIANITDAG